MFDQLADFIIWTLLVVFILCVTILGPLLLVLSLFKYVMS